MTVARPLLLMVIAPFGPLGLFAIIAGPLLGFLPTPSPGLLILSMFAGIAIGIWAILTAPWPDTIRAVVAALYVPLLCAAILAATFVTNCGVYGDCL